MATALKKTLENGSLYEGVQPARVCTYYSCELLQARAHSSTYYCRTWMTTETTHLGYRDRSTTSSSDLRSSNSRSASAGDVIPLSGLKLTSTVAMSAFSILATLAGAGP